MRIHSDTLTSLNVYEAARIARAEVEVTSHGSRSRNHAFNVTLTGESKRRPNSGKRGAGDDYAATWDQWGVFLAMLFALDPTMVTPYYADADEFHERTSDRFDVPFFWPADTHGDHTFRFAGTPREQACTKCSAVQRW